MANEAVVDLQDEAVVTIEVPADAGPADASGETVEQLKQASEAGKQATPAARVASEDAPSAADEAAAQLLEAKRREDAERRRREAAESSFAAERQRAAELERIAEQRGQEVRGLRDTAAQASLATVNMEIEAATKEQAAAKQEFKRASEAGEFDKIADAQVRISDAAAAIALNKSKKAELEASAARAATTVTERTHEGRVTAPAMSPQEQYLAQFADRPAAQAWLRAHPECLPESVMDQNGRPMYLGGNATKNAAMMEAHYAALRQKIPANSPEYFQFLEKKIEDDTSPTSTAAAVVPAQQHTPERKQAAPRPSAPVNNNPPTPAGQINTSRQVRLNKDQQEHALLSFDQKPGETDEQYRARAFSTYAKGLVEATREGKLTSAGRIGH